MVAAGRGTQVQAVAEAAEVAARHTVEAAAAAVADGERAMSSRFDMVLDAKLEVGRPAAPPCQAPAALIQAAVLSRGPPHPPPHIGPFRSPGVSCELWPGTGGAGLCTAQRDGM